MRFARLAAVLSACFLSQAAFARPLGEFLNVRRAVTTAGPRDNDQGMIRRVTIRASRGEPLTFDEHVEMAAYVHDSKLGLRTNAQQALGKALAAKNPAFDNHLSGNVARIDGQIVLGLGDRVQVDARPWLVHNIASNAGTSTVTLVDTRTLTEEKRIVVAKVEDLSDVTLLSVQAFEHP